MGKLKKFLQNAWDAVSGKPEKERDRLKRDLDELQQRIKETLKTTEDFMALATFRARKAADYFNAAAAKHPEMTEEYTHMAQVAATVDVRQVRGDYNAYQPGEATAREWHRIRDRYDREITAYAASHIREFIDADPARWERIEKAVPEKAAKFKPTAP